MARPALMPGIAKAIIVSTASAGLLLFIAATDIATKITERLVRVALPIAVIARRPRPSRRLLPRPRLRVALIITNAKKKNSNAPGAGRVIGAATHTAAIAWNARAAVSASPAIPAKSIIVKG